MASSDQGHASSTDRAGKEYWGERWAHEALPPAIDPRDRSRWNYVNRQLDAQFRRVFGDARGTGRRLLEVGCGNSVWLPYFAREIGFEVEGLDYSPAGCEGARRILEREHVTGIVHLADLFDPPSELSRSFDAVVSLGVVEHFDDTDAAVGAVASLLAPGGIIFTLVPNMNGIPGALQRTINRRVYDAHVPLTPARLAEAHARAGLEVMESRYFLGVNFGVNNLTGLDTSLFLTKAKALGLRILNHAGAATWKLEEALGVAVPRTSALSPFAITTARRAGGAIAEGPRDGKTDSSGTAYHSDIGDRR